MPSIKQRDSNIELCRLACMFYIVVFHLFIHNKDVTGGLYYTRALTAIFSIGVPVFVLISGYFGIKRSVKGFFNIVLQAVFYCLLAILVCHFIFHQSITTDNILGVLFPVTKTQYWFISTYLLLYILAPYLNRLLNSLSRKEYSWYLITLTILVCYWGGIMKVPNCGNRSILLFVFLYSIGRFIRLYYPRAELISKYMRKPWLVYVVVMLLYFVVVSFSPLIVARGINWIVTPYNSIILILFSILFFYSFQAFSIKKEWINYVAKSSFAIYLIHGQNIVSTHRWFYDLYSHYGTMIENVNLRLFYLFGVAIVICTVCVLIDQMRIYFFKYCGIDKLIVSIDEYINNKTAVFKTIE